MVVQTNPNLPYYEPDRLTGTWLQRSCTLFCSCISPTVRMLIVEVWVQTWPFWIQRTFVHKCCCSRLWDTSSASQAPPPRISWQPLPYPRLPATSSRRVSSLNQISLNLSDSTVKMWWTILLFHSLVMTRNVLESFRWKLCTWADWTDILVFQLIYDFIFPLN